MSYMLANLCIYAFHSLNVNYVRRRPIAMRLIGVLLILVVFFIGIGFLIHMCSKHRYQLKYYSKKRKIEICPIDKSQ